jgi:histidine triad (HIT) family protein
MASIFTRIVNGEIPCYRIAEDEDFLAFLDVSPLKEGHTLVIPKKEVDYIFDLGDDQYQSLMLFSKRIARAIKKTVNCKRVTMHVIGLEVPHAHVHLVPINSMNDCNFANTKLKPEQARFEEIAKAIAANVQ